MTSSPRADAKAPDTRRKRMLLRLLARRKMTTRPARCWSPAPPPMPVSPWSSPGCAGCLPARAFGSRRSRRRTCPTTRRSRSTAVRSAAPRRCRPGPRAWRPASVSTPCCSSPAATAPRSWWSAARSSARSSAGTTSPTGRRWRRSVARRIAELQNEFDARHRAKARARRPRSTCARPTSPTWVWPARADLPVVVVGDIDRGGAARAPLRHGRGARARRPAAHLRVPGQQVPRRPRPAGPRTRPSCRP